MMAIYNNPRENIDSDVIWMAEDGSEALRMPGSLRMLIVEAFEEIIEADVTGKLTGDAYLYLSPTELGFALKSNDAIWDAMNAVSKKSADHDRIVDYAYSMLPDWAKSRELLQKKFRVHINDVLTQVSHGFYRGNLKFLE
ncbi:hypothetical protein G3A39_40825, partial [Paraburkholderia aspalathi]|nr:hypothetical protein [Paraburkholderia aspalathi]